MGTLIPALFLELILPAFADGVRPRLPVAARRASSVDGTERPITLSEDIFADLSSVLVHPQLAKPV